MVGAIIVITVIAFGIVTEAQLRGSMPPYTDRETEAQREVRAYTVTPGERGRSLTPAKPLRWFQAQFSHLRDTRYNGGPLLGEGVDRPLSG